MDDFCITRLSVSLNHARRMMTIARAIKYHIINLDRRTKSQKEARCLKWRHFILIGQGSSKKLKTSLESRNLFR